MGKVDETTTNVSSDFQTAKQVGTGFWIEYSRFMLFVGAVGLHGNIGYQQGSKMSFVWMGVGSSAWY